MADDFTPIYSPGSGAPAYDGEPVDQNNSAPSSSNPPADGGGGDSGSDTSPPPSAADNGASGGDDGLIHAGNDGDSGLGINIVDSDGNGDGLINVDSGATSGVGAIDGLTVDAVAPEHLVDAHAPGLADATVDNPGLLDGIGAGTIGDTVDSVGGVVDGLGGAGNLLGGLTGGDGLSVNALGDNVLEVNGQPVLGDVLGDTGLGNVAGGITDGLNVGSLADGATGGILGGDGITVEALNGDNIAEVHAPGVADVTVSGAELAQLGDGLGVGGITDGLDPGGLLGGLTSTGDGLTVEALNGAHVAEAHAPGVADATVGGAELGQILDGIGGTDLGGIGGIGGDGITVDALNGDSVADAHVPQTADVTVGSDLGDGSLLNLGHLIG